MRRAEEDVLAYKGFPREHWAKIHSTNPPERLNKEIRRRTNVVGIIPNETAVTRLLGALMLEQNDEWAITRRYMTLETVAAICDTAPMDPADIAALKLRPSQRRREKPHHSPGHYLLSNVFHQIGALNAACVGRISHGKATAQTVKGREQLGRAIQVHGTDDMPVIADCDWATLIMIDGATIISARRSGARLYSTDRFQMSGFFL